MRYIGLRLTTIAASFHAATAAMTKLRYILKDNRDAVAAADATLPEPSREPVTEAIQLSIGQGRVEIENGRGFAGSRAK